MLPSEVLDHDLENFLPSLSAQAHVTWSPNLQTCDACVRSEHQRIGGRGCKDESLVLGCMFHGSVGWVAGRGGPRMKAIAIALDVKDLAWLHRISSSSRVPRPPTEAGALAVGRAH